MEKVNIGALPRAAQINDESKFPLEQNDGAVFATGAQFKEYAEKSVEPYATEAKNAAESAKSSAESANADAISAKSSSERTESAHRAVSEAKDDIAIYSGNAKKYASQAAQSAQEAEAAKDIVEEVLSDAIKEISDIKVRIGYVDPRTT